jgi:2-hydroxychromene-2-carboxylate isomerase
LAIAIDYYFMCTSPFAYLGHEALHALAARHDATINYKPISIMGVWANSGSVPPAQRTPVRQRYRRIELQRISDIRGLPLNLEPKFFPVDPFLSSCVILALLSDGKDPAGFIGRAHRGVWANDENIADADQLAAYLTAEGHDALPILERAGSGEAAMIIERNTQDAVAADAIGAPVYVYNGEPFWGQDRLDYLDHAITTGRGPFHP